MSVRGLTTFQEERLRIGRGIGRIAIRGQAEQQVAHRVDRAGDRNVLHGALSPRLEIGADRVCLRVRRRLVHRVAVGARGFDRHRDDAVVVAGDTAALPDERDADVLEQRQAALHRRANARRVRPRLADRRRPGRSARIVARRRRLRPRRWRLHARAVHRHRRRRSRRTSSTRCAGTPAAAHRTSSGRRRTAAAAGTCRRRPRAPLRAAATGRSLATASVPRRSRAAASAPARRRRCRR